MKEPSVLDYLKSRLPWSKTRIDFPAAGKGEPGEGTLPSAPHSDEVASPAALRSDEVTSPAALRSDEVAPPAALRSDQAPPPALRPESAPPPEDEGDREIVIKLRMPRGVPLRTFLALALALIGQFIIDPTGFSRLDTGSSLREANSQQALTIGLAFYGLAALLLLWAYLTKEFFLPLLPDEEPVVDPQTVRRGWLIPSIILAFVAFLTLTGNLFTEVNVTLWLVALACFLRSLWLYRSSQKPVAAVDEGQILPLRSDNVSSPGLISKWWDMVLFLGLALLGGLGWFGDNIYLFGLLPLSIGLAILWLRDPDGKITTGQRIWEFLTRDSFRITITRWTLLILAVSALVIFFRLYRIDGIPLEPFSDHAEKLLDVSDVIKGDTHIFFERNTGREFIQFYWSVLILTLFNTGVTFLTLKVGTALIGLLTLPYVYLLGKEIGGKRVALFALILAGVAYWPNTISRIGLRFPLYPAFVAPVLFYLMRGLRTQKRNDFILSGLFLGLGLNGYSPFRFMPFVVIAAVALYFIHKQAAGRRKQLFILFTTLVVASFFVFLPLSHYALDHPGMFSERAMTRLTDAEQPLPSPDWCPQPGNLAAAGCIFVSNSFKAMMMFFWDNGSIWVHSIPGRPALDIVAAVLFGIGYLFLLARYVRERRWQDIVLLISVPMLLMPSILSLAFPDENPSLNRTGGALIVAFVIAALALDGLYNSLRGVRAKRFRKGFALGVVILLLGMSTFQSYNLVFHQFDKQFRAGAWNTSDIGKVMRAFMAEGNSPDNAWVVPFPYWVDTRLAGIQAGLPTKDFAIDREKLPETLTKKGNKLFIVKKGPDKDSNDGETLDVLRQLYPNGTVGAFKSPLEGKDFWIYTVPDSQTAGQ